jgi:hypothetical protein
MGLELGLAALAAAGAIAWAARLLRNRRSDDWQRVLTEAGLESIEREGHPGLGEQITGVMGGVPMRFEPDGARLRIHVDVRVTGVQFDAERGPSGPSFHLDGADDVVKALEGVLSGLVRSALHEAPELSSLTLADAQLTASVDVHRFLASHRPLEGVLPHLRELARLLGTGADAADRLAGLLRSERDHAVRAAILGVLARTHPGHTATDAACEAALRSEHASIRLEAAIGLGEAGRTTLRELTTGRTLSDADTARAVSALGPHLTIQDALAALARARKGGGKGGRKRPRLATARACIEALGTMGPRALEPLKRLVSDEDFMLAADAAEALGETGCAEAEDALIAALGRTEDVVREAAIRGLARVGTVAAMLPLRRAEDEQGSFGRRAGEAIAAIRARTGLAAGQVTLAERAGGEVSLAQDGAGQVSLNDGGSGRDPSGT